jgi:hypothetical protein
MEYSFFEANKIIFRKLILMIWQLPQFVISLFVAAFLNDLGVVASRNDAWCLKTSKIRHGISFGILNFIPEELSDVPEEVAHVIDGHAVDSKIFGPLYIFIILIPSLIWNCVYKHSNGKYYYTFYTEILANSHAKLIAVNNKLRFISELHGKLLI